MLQVLYYALATVVLCFEIYRQGKKYVRERDAIPWEQVTEWIDQLYDSIQAHTPPDVIIGLGRGGAVVAGLISARYRDDPRFHTRVIPIETLDRLYLQHKRETVIVGLHNLDIFGKHVLLLNADSYSGNTLNLAKKLLSYGHPLKQLATGSLVITKDMPEQLRPTHVGAVRSTTEKNRSLPWGRKHPQNMIERLPGPRIIVVLNGLVATGKTSVTSALFKELHYTAIHSDWYWFRQGLQDRDKSLSTNVQHYKHMFSLSLSAAALGNGVVLDTTSSLREIRDYMQDNARRYGIRVVFITCRCSKESALTRIRGRKHIGPYDFGTEYEYRRIEKQYEPINEEETSLRNLIDVDTESLTCSQVHVISDSEKEDVDVEIQKIMGAIENHYLSKLRGRS